jgi:hypothetical protein
MAEIIREYGSAILAAVSTILVFGMIGELLFSDSGVVAQMVLIWCNGGF